MAAKTPQQGQKGQQDQQGQQGQKGQQAQPGQQGQQGPQGEQVQGEGDYAAGRRYDKAAREFAESGKVEPAARDAAPGSAEEAEEMQQAEQTGKSHSKGEGRLTSDKRRA